MEDFSPCEVIGETVSVEVNYKPIGSTIIVEVLSEEKDPMHPRGNNNGPTVERGRVIAIGDGKVEDKIYPCPVKVDDVVIYTQHSGDKIAEKKRIIGFRHVLAIEC